MGTGELNAGGNPAMDWHPIQGGVEILLVASCLETGISSGLMSHLAREQTLPYLPYSEQIMSADKYPSIFSRQMEAIVYIYHSR